MRRVVLVLLVVLAPLVAGPSAAQVLGGVSASLSQEDGDAAPGTLASAWVVVRNDGLQEATARLVVPWTREVVADHVAEVRVPAQRGVQVRVDLYVAHAAPLGERHVPITVWHDSGATNLTFRLHVREPDVTTPRAPGAPVVAPRDLGTLAAPAGGVATFEILVRNPANASRNLSVFTLARDGWNASSASLRATTFAAGEERLLPLKLFASSVARSAPARVVVVDDADATRVAFADAWLEVEGQEKGDDPSLPTEPSPETPANETPANETPPDDAPVNETPTNETPADAPPPLPLDVELRHDYRGAPGRVPLVVPEGAHGIAWIATFDAQGASRPGSAPVVRLLDPSGATVAGCSSSPCHDTSPTVPAGNWTVAFEGGGPATVVLRVRVTEELPRHLMPPEWRLAHESTHRWGEGDAERAFTLDGPYASVAHEVWRPGDAPLPGTAVLLRPDGVEHSRCASTVCWGQGGWNATAGAEEWRVRWIGPSEGASTLRVWVLPAAAPAPPAEAAPAPTHPPTARGPGGDPATGPEAAPRAAPPDAPPPFLSIEVDPAEVVVRPGGGAHLVVRVTSRARTPTPFALEARLPEGVTALADGAPAHVPALGQVEVLLTLRASARLEPGNRLPGSFQAAGAEPGAFTVVIGERAPPPEDDAQADAASAPASGPPSRAPVVAGLAAAVGALALGVAWARRRWPLVGLAALYAKLRPQRVLDSGTRLRIVEAVRAEPGIAVAQLQRRLGLANGEVAHHLRVLERNRLLASARDGRLRRVYPAEMGRAPATPDLGARALALLRERPRTASALARDLGVSRQALHYHLKKLVAQGLVDPRPDGALAVAGAGAAEASSDDRPVVRA